MAFVVSLKQAHEQKGDAIYRVSKNTGLARQTVTLYATHDEVSISTLYPAVIVLAKYYGVRWQDVVKWRDEVSAG